MLQCPGCGGNLIAKTRAASNHIYACQAAAQGRDCPRGIAVECVRVEAEVGRQFLRAVGRFEVVEARTSVRDVARMASVDESIRDTTDSLRDPSADVTALVERLHKLRAERERLEALPAEPVVALVATGETFAEAWPRLGMLERRRMLLNAGAQVDVARARQRGKWDPSRVTLTLQA